MSWEVGLVDFMDKWIGGYGESGSGGSYMGWWLVEGVGGGGGGIFGSFRRKNSSILATNRSWSPSVSWRSAGSSLSCLAFEVTVSWYFRNERASRVNRDMALTRRANFSD